MSKRSKKRHGSFVPHASLDLQPLYTNLKNERKNIINYKSYKNNNEEIDVNLPTHKKIISYHTCPKISTSLVNETLSFIAAHGVSNIDNSLIQPTLSESMTQTSELKSFYSNDYVLIYTDGACTNNGGCNKNLPTIGGIGVYFPNKEYEDVYERFPGKQTNQTAELRAVIRALQIVDPNSPIELRSDSQYAVGICNEGLLKWDDKIVTKQNLDLLIELKECLKLRNAPTHIVHIARSADSGNVEADRLSKKATHLPAPL